MVVLSPLCTDRSVVRGTFMVVLSPLCTDRSVVRGTFMVVLSPLCTDRSGVRGTFMVVLSPLCTDRPGVTRFTCMVILSLLSANWPGVTRFTCMVILSSLCADRPGVRQLHIVQKLHEKIFSALKLEIGNNHVDHEDVLSQFVHHACLLRSLSQHHLALLSRFKGENPDVDFPPLHQELFSLDPTDNT